MKKLTKLTALLMTIALVVSCVTVSAYDKHVETVNFKIVLNNRDVNLDKEMVTINDSTYLPLRALCEELLGMDVTWHQDTQTIELWNITKPVDRGSHEAPIPLKAAVTGEFQAKDKTYVNYEFAIESIERGKSAYTKVENWYRQIHPYEAPDNEAQAAKARAKYEEKVAKYMQDVLGDSSKYEILIAKAHIDIKPSASTFELKTSDKDITPYCGIVNIDGFDRKYVEYSVPKVDMPSENAYAGRTILTNGIQEGYVVLRVYKNDTTPRIMYKDGQYLSLY